MEGLITNFSRGEISPLFYGRIDTDIYKQGAKELLNGIVVESGAVIRRPGTRFSGAAAYAEKDVLMVPFPESTGDKFMVELGDLYARFHKDGTRIDDGGSPVELATPWGESVLRDLTYIVNEDELVVAYNGLKRITKGATDTDWSIEDVDWYANKSTDLTPPTIDSATKLSGAEQPDIGKYSFSAGDVGQRLYLKTSGDKEGYFTIESFVDTKEEYRKVEKEGDPSSYVETSVTVPDNYVTGTYTQISGVDITDGDVITDWAIQPYDMTTLSPDYIAAVDGRFIIAGMSGKPLTFMGSRTFNKWEFRRGYEDNDGYEFTLKESYGTSIYWIAGRDRFVIGTDNGIYTIGQGESITPTTAFSLSRQSANRASRLMPIFMGDKLVYVQKPGNNIRVVEYNDDSKSYITPSVTAHAEHLFRDGITSLDYQQNPREILWVVSGGDLLTLSYNEHSGIIGWSKQSFDGTVKDVAVVEGIDGQDDVYIALERTIGGTTYTHFEKFVFYRLDLWEDCWYVDSGSEWVGEYLDCTSLSDEGVIVFDSAGPAVGDVIHFYANPPGITGVAGNKYKLASGSDTTFTLNTLDDEALSGLGSSTGSFQVREAENEIDVPAHFADGTDIRVFTDDGTVTSPTLASQTVTLPTYHCVIRAGLPYTNKIKTLPVPAAIKEPKKVYEVGIMFFESHAGYLKDEEGDVSHTIIMDDDIVLDGALNLFTGIKRLSYHAAIDYYGVMCLESDLPVPMNVMSIAYSVDWEGKR